MKDEILRVGAKLGLDCFVYNMDADLDLASREKADSFLPYSVGLHFISNCSIGSEN